MSKLMWIAGILLIAAGVAFGAVNLVSLQPAAARISLDSSVILLVGGILALGLGSVIDALHAQRPAIGGFGAATAAVAGVAAVSAMVETPVAEKAEAAAETTEISAATGDTLSALEKARQKMEQAFQPKQDVTEAADTAEAVVEEVADDLEEVVSQDAIVEDEVLEEDAVIEDGQLYVVEERIIRRRPARILSDGTVEAETDEGWMRFENLEHLDEYLDAMEPARG
jgi:predicted lipid-binding transport protein (Tim44 family)